MLNHHISESGESSKGTMKGTWSELCPIKKGFWTFKQASNSVLRLGP